MIMTKENTEEEKTDKEENKRDFSNFIAAIVSTLLGMLGSIMSSFSLFGLQWLSTRQIIILGSLLLGIAVVAYIIMSIQKAGYKTRIAVKKIVSVYISHLENTIINPVVKK
jgi:hypothetical protein